MEKSAERNYLLLKSKTEQAGWVKDRLDWAAIERLRAQEEHAKSILVGCLRYCKEQVGEAEWAKQIAWICKSAPNENLCKR